MAPRRPLRWRPSEYEVRRGGGIASCFFFIHFLFCLLLFPCGDIFACVWIGRPFVEMTDMPLGLA